MGGLCWLTDAQMARLRPFWPVSHGIARVDDKRVLSGIVFFNRNGLRCRDAPADHGPHKTFCNRWFGWSKVGGGRAYPAGIGPARAGQPVDHDGCDLS
jgi:transposase